MGLWGWIVDKARAAKDWIDEKIDAVKRHFSKNKYDSRSVSDQVDAEKVLAKFKKDLNREARFVEQENITTAMKHFDDFSESLRGYFPELTELVEKEKEKSKTELTGIIMDYIGEHISENDPKFRRILEMQPSDEKVEKLDKQMRFVLNGAEKAFTRKLKKKLENLDALLNTRLSERIKSEEQLLEKTKSSYEELMQKSFKGMLNMEELECEHLPVIEMANCLEKVLEVGGNRA